MSDVARARARDGIARLAVQGLDLITFWRRASDILSGAVPHYLSPCWFTLDPASHLVTSHFQSGLPELPPEWLAHEYYDDDVHKMADVASSRRGFSSLHEATGGDPSRSPAWRQYMRPYGADQELLVALRTRTGQSWGMLGLYREPGAPLFGNDEIQFLCELSPMLADGSMRSLLIGEATEPEGPAAPGLVVLREDWSVESTTPGVERWLDELSDGDWSARARLPAAVLSIAGRAMRAFDPAEPSGGPTLARAPTRSGRWVTLHGAALEPADVPQVAVIIEPAQPARIATLLMAAYGLTAREQDVTRLVLQGSSTVEIAATLSISTHTVQQHLKRIFDKTDVRSRRDLVGRVFFSHYEPRLRDNERRAVDGRPIRGGPASAKLHSRSQANS